MHHLATHTMNPQAYSIQRLSRKCPRQPRVRRICCCTRIPSNTATVSTNIHQVEPTQRVRYEQYNRETRGLSTVYWNEDGSDGLAGTSSWAAVNLHSWRRVCLPSLCSQYSPASRLLQRSTGSRPGPRQQPCLGATPIPIQRTRVPRRRHRVASSVALGHSLEERTTCTSIIITSKRQRRVPARLVLYNFPVLSRPA